MVHVFPLSTPIGGAGPMTGHAGLISKSQECLDGHPGPK